MGISAELMNWNAGTFCIAVLLNACYIGKSRFGLVGATQINDSKDVG